MTIQEFLNEKTCSHIEICENLIINLIVDDVVYGINVDTSHIESSIVLERTDNFVIEGNSLIYGEIVVDITTTNML
jgi:hypothetical protein